jgi:hypothetical protein
MRADRRRQLLRASRPWKLNPRTMIRRRKLCRRKEKNRQDAAHEDESSDEASTADR